MLYLTCTTITSVDLAHYRVSRAKDWVSVDCGTNIFISGKVIIVKYHKHSKSSKPLTRVFQLYPERMKYDSGYIAIVLCLFLHLTVI